MSVARVTEISGTSNQSFEDAVRVGIRRASKSLRQIRGAWVKEQHVTEILSAPRVLAAVTSVISALAPQALREEPVTAEDLVRIRISYVTARSFCTEAADLVHTAAGTSTLPGDSVIGRCWRDLHALTSVRRLNAFRPEGPADTGCH